MEDRRDVGRAGDSSSSSSSSSDSGICVIMSAGALANRTVSRGGWTGDEKGFRLVGTTTTQTLSQRQRSK